MTQNTPNTDNHVRTERTAHSLRVHKCYCSIGKDHDVSTPSTDELDEKITSYSIHDKDCGITITHDLGNCDCNHLELKALIEAQIQAYALEARLDELDRMPVTFASRDSIKRYYEKRRAKLTKGR